VSSDYAKKSIMSEVIDLYSIHQMLTKLSEKQDSMSDRLNDIDTHLSKISSTVIGDEKFGHKGLVQQVATLNRYVENDKLRNAKVVGGLGVVGILWTLFLKFISLK
jgi:hypothetical protein